VARHQPPRQAPRQGGPPPSAPYGAGTSRRVPWRLVLLVALIAAVALVLASKPTRENATVTTAPTSTVAAATVPAVTAPATTVPAATARAATTPPATARATTAPVAVAPTASHAREERPVRLPRLVDLGADRCIPCKAMAPILVELRAEYAGRLQVDFIDVWKDPSAGDPYNIYSIPTQIFFDEDDRELTRHQGFISKADILATWKRLGYDLSAGPASPAS
jgi:thioredoxin 1